MENFGDELRAIAADARAANELKLGIAQAQERQDSVARAREQDAAWGEWVEAATPIIRDALRAQAELGNNRLVITDYQSLPDFPVSLEINDTDDGRPSGSAVADAIRRAWASRSPGVTISGMSKGEIQNMGDSAAPAMIRMVTHELVFEW